MSLPVSPAQPPTGTAQPPTGPATPGTGSWRSAALDAFSVVWRCVAVLSGLAVVVVLVAGATSGDVSADSGGLGIIGIAWLVHVAVTLVVGYPVGVVVSRVLPEGVSRLAATGAFALAGAVAGSAVVMVAGFPPVVWFVLGGVTAGGARAWAHGPVRRRALGEPWPVPKATTREVGGTL